MYGTYQRELIRSAVSRHVPTPAARVIMDPGPSSNQGIQGWSTQCPFDSYVIFCVGQSILRQKQFMAWAEAQQIGFKALCGSYKGQSENSFIVNQKDFLRCGVWWKGEESALILSKLYRNGTLYGSRKATLYYIDRRPGGWHKEIGSFRNVSREYALKQDNWTLDPTTGEYYVAGPCPS